MGCDLQDGDVETLMEMKLSSSKSASHEVDAWYDQVITVHNWCTYHLYTKDIWDVEYESLV